MAYDTGKYLCEVIGQGFGELPNEKKTPYFFLEVKPLGLINPGDPKGDLIYCNDFPRTANMFLTEDAIPYTVDRLRSLGWSGTSFKEIEPTGSHSFVGQQIELICSHRESGGKTYDKFDFPPLGGGKSAESDPNVARKMDVLYGKALQTTMPASTKTNQESVQQIANAVDNPPTPAAEPVAAAAGDGTEDKDDIPF